MKTINIAVALAVVAIVTAGMVVIPNLGVTHNVEAKSKSKTGTIKIKFSQAYGYTGKAKLKITNVDTEKVLVDKKIDFSKLKRDGSDRCCYKLEYKLKANHDGDLLFSKVTAGPLFWKETNNLVTPKMTWSLDVADIDCLPPTNYCDD